MIIYFTSVQLSSSHLIHTLLMTILHKFIINIALLYILNFNDPKCTVYYIYKMIIKCEFDNQCNNY